MPRVLTVVVLAGMLVPPAGAAGLDALLAEALRSYPSVAVRRAQQEAAESDRVAAQRQYLPTPSVSTQRSQVAYGSMDAATRPVTTLGLTQPLYMGGGLDAGRDRAVASLGAAELGVLEAREDVSRRVVAQYADSARAYAKVRALEESLAEHERLAALIERRAQSGVASSADRDLALSRLYQTQAELEVHRAAERTALVALGELVGRPVMRTEVVLESAAAWRPPARTDGVAHALAASPSLRRSRFDGEATEAAARQARAQGAPQVLLQAQRQIGSTYAPGVPNQSSIGVVLQYAPGAGLSSYATAAAALQRARAAALQSEVVQRELIDRLNADYSDYEAAIARRDGLLRAVELAGEISGSYDRQYLVGRKTWIELMNAVRERAQTRAALADAEGALLAASRRLQIAIHGTER